MKAFFKGFVWAWRGLWYGLRTQRNVRIHAFATLVAIVISAGLQLTAVEWAVLLLTCGLVWTAELINTALEVTLDRISRERDVEIGLAKDVAAGAVLAAAIFALGVGFCLWLPKVWLRH
jgi:diacylglycerol kinase